MKNFMNNFRICALDDAKHEIKLVNEIHKIPGVDEGSIKSYWSYDQYEDLACGAGIRTTSKQIHVNFGWHDHNIEIYTTGSQLFAVKADGNLIGDIMWDAKDGSHRTTYSNDLKKWEKWIMEALAKATFRISNRGSKFAMHTDITFGDDRIWVEGSRIMFTDKNGKTVDIAGNSVWGSFWWCDYYMKYVEFIKRNFLRK